jgi:hypothetical protein
MLRRCTIIFAAALAVSSAARAAAPPPPAQSLAGATPVQVKARLGEPAVASQAGKGALWTYRREGCALMVFFRDEGRGLRVSSLTANARKRGDPVPDVAACLESGS